MRIQNLLNTTVLELPAALGINSQIIEKETQRLIEIANHCISSNGKWVKIVSEAEISCLALSSELTNLGIENIIAIDERTTRMLAEKPQNLKQIMEKKLHISVQLDSKNLNEFKKFKFIRSTELVYVAHKKNLLKIKGPKVLEAVLYATKFKGSSVTFDEIEILKKL